MHEIKGVFAFLKCWIAIETLAMPDGTNIRPAILTLAAAYNMSEAEARDFFAIGRLFSLRGDIVHRGLTPRMDQYLLAYIEGVYVDLLAQVLGVGSRIAQATLERDTQTAAELTARARS
jgi:hypothetical protein